jgi:hypothetical protein
MRILLADDGEAWVPDQLKSQRVHAGLSQTDVASALLLSVAQVHGLETGLLQPFHNKRFYERARAKYITLLLTRPAPSRHSPSLAIVEETPALRLTF